MSKNRILSVLPSSQNNYLLTQIISTNPFNMTALASVQLKMQWTRNMSRGIP